MPQSIWTPAVGLMLAGSVVALSVLGCPPRATADSTNGAAVCHSSQESGVEVDTCTGNPNPPAADPGEGVRVIPEFCFGLGFGGCDDD